MIEPVSTPRGLRDFINLLYRATYEALFKGQIRLEINYVLEDNHRMNHALLRLGVMPLRRYRVYQMDK